MLITKRIITDIQELEGYDNIELAFIDGWQVIVNKHTYSINDEVYYIEVDTVIPKGDPVFESLMLRDQREYTSENGESVVGHRLKTLKIRGILSQGYIFTYHADIQNPDEYFKVFRYYCVYDLVDQEMNPRRSFPLWIPKTSIKRVQNLKTIQFNNVQIEEKLEGSSMTIYFDGETVGVTTKEIDLKIEDTESNRYINTARQTNLLKVLPQLYSSNDKIAIQGELIGPKIQKNIYKLDSYQFHVFNIFFNGKNLLPKDRIVLFIQLYPMLNNHIIKHVPILHENIDISNHTRNDLICLADGISQLYKTKREGVVIKSIDTGKSFKVISNEYLLKQK